MSIYMLYFIVYQVDCFSFALKEKVYIIVSHLYAFHATINGQSIFSVFLVFLTVIFLNLLAPKFHLPGACC